MAYRLLADATVGVHFLFILFVVGGSFLVRRARWLALPHLLCVLWGVYVELAGVVCPLTPLENRLSRLAGQAGYAGGFIEHYLVPVMYPENLTWQLQWVLAALVVVTNGIGYGVLLKARARRGA